jgi:hypothetical protein
VRKRMMAGVLVALAVVASMAAGDDWTRFPNLQIGGGYGGSGVGGDSAGLSIDDAGDVTTNGSVTADSGLVVPDSAALWYGTGGNFRARLNSVTGYLELLDADSNVLGYWVDSGATANFVTSGSVQLGPNFFVYNPGICGIQAGDSAGRFRLYSAHATPVAPSLEFAGKNGVGAQILYARSTAQIVSSTAGSEIGKLSWAVMGGTTPGTTLFDAMVLSGAGLDIKGVLQAGSGNVDLTNSTGNVRLAALENSGISAGSYAGSVTLNEKGIATAAVSYKQNIQLPASFGWPKASGGCALPQAAVVGATYPKTIRVLDFDKTTSETAVFEGIPLPDDYNGGAFTVSFHWLCTSVGGSGSTGTVMWKAAARAYANGEAIDQALGTTVSTTAVTTAAVNTDYYAAATATMTPSGSPAAREWLYVEVWRDTANDSLDSDARLVSVCLEYAPRSE